MPTGYLSMAINMGNFATTYGIAEKHTNEDKTWYWTAMEGVTFPVEVTFEMKEKGGYMAEYLLHDLTRTNNREDYKDLTDEQFANFRMVGTTLQTMPRRPLSMRAMPTATIPSRTSCSSTSAWTSARRPLRTAWPTASAI